MIGFLQHTTHTSFHNTSKLHLHPGNNLDTLSTSYGFPHQSSIDSNPCSLLLNIHIASYISVGSLNTSKLHLGNLDPLFHIVWFSPPVFHRLKFLLLPTQHPRHIASRISVGSTASSAFCPSPLTPNSRSSFLSCAAAAPACLIQAKTSRCALLSPKSS